MEKNAVIKNGSNEPDIFIVASNEHSPLGLLPSSLQRLGIRHTIMHREFFATKPGRTLGKPLILLGGTQSLVSPLGSDLRLFLAATESAMNAGSPVLGICLGAQALALISGATVIPHPSAILEIGYHPVQTLLPSTASWLPSSRYYHWHYDIIAHMPAEYVFMANENAPVQAFALTKRLVGFQFHPEINRAAIQFRARLGHHRLREPGIQSLAVQMEFHNQLVYRNARSFDSMLRRWWESR